MKKLHALIILSAILLSPSCGRRGVIDAITSIQLQDFGIFNVLADLFATGSALAPEVTGISPAKDASGVVINTSISASFSTDMNPSSISTTSFILMKDQAPVAGTVAYDSSGKTAVFTPGANLATNSLYTAIVTVAVRSARGGSMVDQYSWSFTTGTTIDVTPPTVSSTVPAGSAAGESLNSSIWVNFSETMNSGTVTTATFLLAAGGSAVTGTVSYTAATNTAVFTPVSNLAANTVYTATVKTGAQDLASNGLAADYTWTFTTGATNDSVPPGEVTNFSATSQDGQVSLTWANPADTDMIGVIIVRKAGSSPADHRDGVPVYTGAGGAATDTGLTNGTTYYYAAFTFDAVPNYSSGSRLSAVPVAASAGAAKFDSAVFGTDKFE